jgi:hypothetical protein
MSSAFWERRGRTWIAVLQSFLPRCQAYSGWRKSRNDPDQLVMEVADDLCATMQIWVVDDGIQTRGHIAFCHRLMETYRSYLLCSDSAGQTFLIDLRTRTYVEESSTRQLLEIDGVDQARRFVDELCLRPQLEQK